MERLIPLFGIFVFLLIAYLLSIHKKQVRLETLLWGILLQFLFAILVFGVPVFGWRGPLSPIFAKINDIVLAIITYTAEGSEMAFGPLADQQEIGFIFVVQIVPVILFFSALTAVAYHLNIFQKVVGVLGAVMKKFMVISGAESLSVASNVFIGPAEAILMVRPYVERMTKSEIMALMVGGLATIDASVLPAYVSLLKDRIPDITNHLITASVMSAPAAFVIAKIMVPETQTPQTLGEIKNLKMKKRFNHLMEAITSGTTDGLKLSLNMIAMVIVFICFVALVNGVLGWWGSWFGFSAEHPLTLEWIFGVLFAPIAWLMGIPWQESLLVGSLLGQKMALNEFIAYLSLSEVQYQLSDRSIIIASYALCGFANFGSIGIIVGAMNVIAPSRQSDFTQLGIKSMIGGSLATVLTAAIVAILL